MALPAITLTDPINTTEVWNMFWEACKYINSLPPNVLDFGSDYDFSSSSKNLSPSKIRFQAPFGGHDHKVSGRRLHWTAIKKRNFDLNGLSVLWHSYFTEGQDTVRYVLLSGVLHNISYVGAGSANEFQFKGRVVTTYPYAEAVDTKEQMGTGSDLWNYDSKIDIGTHLDTTWGYLYSSQYKVLAVMAHPYEVASGTAYRPYTFVQYDGTNWYVQYRFTDQSAAVTEDRIEVNVLVLVKYDGIVPPGLI